MSSIFRHIETNSSIIFRAFIISGIIIGVFARGYTSLLLTGIAVVVFIIGIAIRFYYAEKIWANRKTTMFETLNSPEYLEWQQTTIEALYDDLNITTLYGKRYPAATISANTKTQYPFDQLLGPLEETAVQELSLNRHQRRYLRILKSSLRYPKLKGFALKEVKLDAKGHIKRVDARVSDFEQNIATAHFLEWELYNLYRKRNALDFNNGTLLQHLKKRALYHNGRPAAEAIRKPNKAFPLISVQALIVYKDYSKAPQPQWEILLAKRSDEVIVKPGYFQFQPAGGFELFGAESDDIEYQIKQGYDVRSALFREYAEEIFNAEHLQYRTNSADSGSVFSDENVKYLIKLIDNEKAHVDFLGMVVDLTLLRHELSFLILIDDKKFSKTSFAGSWEARNILSVKPNELKEVISTGELTCSSAGLLKLAMKNKRLKALGISKKLVEGTD